MSIKKVSPPAALVMYPGVDAMLVSEAGRSRLKKVVSLEPESAFVDLAESGIGAERLAKIEVLLTGWGCPTFGAEVLDQLPALRMIAHGAGTVRGLVSPELWARGITVTSAASANAVPVADFTLAAIIMIDKDVFGIRHRHRLSRGTKRVVDQGLVGQRGRRIGLIGASTIGRLVAERLRTLEVDVVIFDPFVSAAEIHELGAAKVGLEELLSTSAVVSIHAPALDSTHHMLGPDQLAMMVDHSWLINTARGSLVDPDALEAELVSGRISAFIDTPEPEPLPPDSPLYDLENVILTPHIAGSLGGEISRMGDLAVTEIKRFVSGRPPLHPVTENDMRLMA